MPVGDMESLIMFRYLRVSVLVMLSIRGLVDAFGRGVVATLQDIKHDETRRQLFAGRLEKMVHELPFIAAA